MREENYFLRIGKKNLQEVAASFVIGVLHLIRIGAFPPVVGIWTMSTRGFWSPLVDNKILSDELIDVLRNCDELSALQKLNPDHFESEITKLIERIEKDVQYRNPHWDMDWVINDELDEQELK